MLKITKAALVLLVQTKRPHPVPAFEKSDDSQDAITRRFENSDESEEFIRVEFENFEGSEEFSRRICFEKSQNSEEFTGLKNTGLATHIFEKSEGSEEFKAIIKSGNKGFENS